MKVICIEAKEPSIPLIEGDTYTVKTSFVGPQGTGDYPISEMDKTPGFTLEEVDGHFRADRFRVVEP